MITERRASVRGLDVRLRAYPPGYTQPEHEHDEAIVNVVLCGTVEESTERAAIRTDAWAFYVRPPRLRHANRYQNGTTRVLTIRCLDGMIGPSPERAGDLLELRRLRLVVSFLETIQGRTATGIGAVSNDLDLLIPAESERARAAGDRERTARRRVEEARERLDAPESGTVGEAASFAGMHRVAFARSFRRRYGVSPSEYRTWDRVRRAASHLGQSSVPLSEVAVDAGFADQSHMCRDFRRILGLTPSAYRSLIDPESSGRD